MLCAGAFRTTLEPVPSRARHRSRRRRSTTLRRRPRPAGARVPQAATGAARGARPPALPRPDPAADRRAARRADRHRAIAAPLRAPCNARRPRGGRPPGAQRESTVMTSERDFDSALDRWMDDGPTIVADRVIAAAMTDVHTTRQRGARWALLKELFMTMKPATMVLGVVAVIVVGIAAYQYSLGGLSIGGPGEPRIVAANELPGIVLTADDAPDGMTFDGT